MAKCPACNHDVRTPSFLNLEAWRHLACGHCQARLELKPPRSAFLGPLIAPLFILARRGPVFAAIAFGFLFLTISALLWESARPKLQLRKKATPEPSAGLDLDGGTR